MSIKTVVAAHSPSRSAWARHSSASSSARVRWIVLDAEKLNHRMTAQLNKNQPSSRMKAIRMKPRHLNSSNSSIGLLPKTAYSFVAPTALTTSCRQDGPSPPPAKPSNGTRAAWRPPRVVFEKPCSIATSEVSFIVGSASESSAPAPPAAPPSSERAPRSAGRRRSRG